MEEKKEVKGTINYTLTIDPKGEDHSISYEDSIENGIAALMMATHTLGTQLEHQKEYKKKASSKVNKDAIGANINKISAAIRGVQVLQQAILNNYLEFKEHQAKTG